MMKKFILALVFVAFATSAFAHGHKHVNSVPNPGVHNFQDQWNVSY
jgi:hypothetical protein